MNKYLKYGLWLVGGVLASGAAVIAYIALTFDPNEYKSQIIQAVKDSRQRTLSMEGDIKLYLYPSIGVSLGKVALSEFQSEQEFVSVESARVSLKLLPLLARHLVVDEVVVSGVNARFVKFKDGKTNYDDLMAKKTASDTPVPGAEQSAALDFDIAAVNLDKTTLSYSDETSGAHYVVKDLSLKSGRIANAVPTRIDFSARIQSGKPRLDIVAQIKTTLTLDLEKGLFQVQGLDLQANGDALDISGLSAKASGDASVQPGSRQFSMHKFLLGVSGMKGKARFHVNLDAPALSLSGDKFSGDGVAVNAKYDGALGNVALSLELPNVEGSARTFKVSSMLISADLKQPQQTFKLKLSSPVTGSIETQQFNMKDLKLALNATGDKLPGKNIDSELKGSVQADFARQYIEADLAGGLLQSQIKAKFAVKNFNVPMIRYDLEIDQLDADPYLPKSTDAGAQAKRKEAPEQPFDFSALKTLNLEGSVRVGSLKAANIKLAQLRVDMKAKDGILNIAPLSAKLYKGSMDGKATLNANTSGFTARQNLSGVDIAPLLKDVADLELAEGRGNVVLDIVTQGDTVSGLKKALNGKASVSLTDGAIKGIDLSRLVQGIQNLSRETTAQTLGVDKNEKTTFSEFKASFKIRNGVAHNDDLAVKSSVLSIAGSGDIDIGRDSINYNAKATFAKSEQGKSATLPVNVSGPFDNLKFKVDYAALLKDVAKQKLDEKKEQLKEDAKAKAREELKKGLKRLFK